MKKSLTLKDIRKSIKKNIKTKSVDNGFKFINKNTDQIINKNPNKNSQNVNIKNLKNIKNIDQTKFNKFKILIYTDSRGEHVPNGSNHTIYTKRLKNNSRLDVTLFLCPMKWTTTLDFLEMVNEKNIDLGNYDMVILHTGIVEHSPRHKTNAVNRLYNNKLPKHNYNVDFNKQKGKSENSKKEIFDKIFGEQTMQNFMDTDLGVKYENDDTLNMYNLNMAKQKLIPVLKKIPNLLWISANNIVKGWRGNYFRERPKNIDLIEDYSKLFVKYLPKTLNLHKWSDEEVKKYTCDNMHLSSEGSDYIYSCLMKIINFKIKNKDTLVIMGNGPSLKEIDFGYLQYVDTFGLNLAYRVYDELNFYPTYFGCFDYKVTDYHKDKFQKLVNTLPIKQFYFIRDSIKGTNVINIKLETKSTQKLFVDKNCIKNLWNVGNSGANACHVGIALGYKKIILVGVDCSYIDVLPEAKLMPNGALKIIKTPIVNPNYWFDSYQQEGDIYNVPNTDIYHQPGWKLLSEMTKDSNVEIINCSPGSTLKCFTKSNIENEIITKHTKPTVFSTIVFNLKHNSRNKNFDENFEYVLKWFEINFDKNYFDYLIIEQTDSIQKIKIPDTVLDIQHILLYNDKNYNRGWGYNVAVKNYINTDTVAFFDSDIILSEPNKLLDAIEICKNNKKLVSPYRNVHFTTETERFNILKENFDFKLKPKYPVTVSGGIAVVNVEAFKNVGGFEEYNTYGGEDRSLDVLFETFYDNIMLPGFGIHLFHQKSVSSTSVESINMMVHLTEVYNCTFKNLKKSDYIHSKCNHINISKNYIKEKIKKYGHIDLYRVKINSNSNDKTLFIMGNGPSLKEVMNNSDYLNMIKNNHSFGLNAAYRAYDKFNFYPTYFGCFDYVVNESHKEEFSNLVLNNEYIKKYFFIGNNNFGQNMYKQKVRFNNKFVNFNFKNINIDKFNGISKDFQNYYNVGSSGANALQIGIMLGYKKIVLLGCDCNYVERIDGVQHYDPKSKNRLVLTKNPKVNPNYWFDGYQTKGDKFNLPNTSKFQMGSWRNINNFCPSNIEIINGSIISAIPFFNKQSIKKMYKENIDKIITKSLNYWNQNKTFSCYFDDNVKTMLLNSLKIDSLIKYTRSKDIEKKILDDKVKNYFDVKFMSFVLVLKNRNERTEIFINNLKNVKNFNKYCELIIVEDTSKNLIDIKNLLDSGLDTKYYLVDTKTSWSRCKLINYGIKKSKLQLSLICDVDFVFDPNFINIFRESLLNYNFNKYGLCIPVFETNTSYKKFTNILRRTNENYGHVWIMDNTMIKTIGGYKFNIDNHGFEERELWIRGIINGYEFIYVNKIFNKLYTLHLSHDNITRGNPRRSEERISIINDTLKTKVKFEYKLDTLKSLKIKTI